MKQEIKQLYKKDKKLAIKVAKALGYKVNVKKKCVKAQGDSLLYRILDYKKLLNNMDDVYDEQTSDLARDIWIYFSNKLTLKSAEKEAFNRLVQSMDAGKNWKSSLHRNNIFKAANRLGMKLPSSSF